MSSPTAIRKTTTARMARSEIWAPQLEETLEPETPPVGANALVMAAFPAATDCSGSTFMVTWMVEPPRVCTASAVPAPSASSMTLVTLALLTLAAPALGTNVNVVPPAKSVPRLKPRSTIIRIEPTTRKVENM